MTTQTTETESDVEKMDALLKKFEDQEREIAELKARVDSKPVYGNLPEKAFVGGDGLLYHKVTRILEGGSSMEQTRRLAASLEEAREKRLDFYHPKLGLIWEGYKLAADRDAQDVLNDKTNTTIRKDS